MSAERERVCWCVAGLWGDDVEALCLVKECRELERDDVEALCLVNECRELERDDVEALCLVKECRELERNFGTKFTEKLLKVVMEFLSNILRRSSSRLVASSPGSSAWAEKQEPGTHCLRMLSSPRISGGLDISVKSASLH